MPLATQPVDLTPRLVGPSGAPRPAITPDEDQQRVIDHRDGPLLVLAGPGTGKTATVVELVADRVQRGGLRPEQVLVLTFSRRAADELRVRLASRLKVTVAGRLAWTFHAWCYAVLRSFDPTLSGTPIRLLSGPEQDVVVRDLLKPAPPGDEPPPGPGWPPEWLPIVGLRGFADEVRGLLARCQERGVEPADLEQLGRITGRPAWQSLAPFYADYLANLDWQGAVDYSGLVRRTARLLSVPEVLGEVARDIRLIVVDEYQDTDPAQEQVLQTLSSAGPQLVVVGDPDQSIYAFRGAEVGGILNFPDRFRGKRGRPAKVLALGGCRRSGEALLAASRSVARRLPLPGLPAEAVTSHRELAALGPSAPEPAVSVRLFPSPAQEASAVADVLRRAHLIDGLAWSSMAILVRSTRLAGPLQRALADAGVPVETPADERPLVREPVLEPLLTLLRVGAGLAKPDEDVAVQLLSSPLGGADALDVRRLRRALHVQERSGGGRRRSGELIVECLEASGGPPVGLAEDVSEAPRRIASLLSIVRRGVAEGHTPEQVLWAVWSASRWRHRLVETVRRPGRASAALLRHADRQLDAVVALFEAAARFTDRLPAAGLEVFLEGLDRQEIPADPLSQRGSGAPAGAVRLLTAHRSKGLEWDLVVVAGVQDGSWPDLRRRSTLLEADALASAEQEPTLFAAEELVVAARAEALVEERRLFYVAITRARRRLLVTAVSGGDDGELRPSRFLSELGAAVPAQTEIAPRVLSLPALVAELRCVASDPESSPALREAAVAELAELAPDVPSADPKTWWGLASWTERELPLLPEGGAVTLSPSQVEAIKTCPLRWFLVRRAGVASASTSSQGFGTLIHDLARHIVDSGITSLPELEKRLDLHWPQIDWEAPWYSARERIAAREALAKLLEWHQGRPHTVVGAELDFDLELDLVAGRARIRGQIDRLERDSEGRGVVVDYKTGRSTPSYESARESPQLGLYQLAVLLGAVRPAAGPEGDDAPELTGSAGAALLQLRNGKERGQPPLEPDPEGQTWVHELLERLVSAIAAESFPARRNDTCDTCPVRRCCPARPEGAQVA
ncbi:MAG TPA: ATP-dependent DNA helicase [Frankiaceae bacterium]|nr:ATP-dependent DNA helicase [Frankiaceae bacterium]